MSNDDNFKADELMIQAVSLFGKASSLKGISKVLALKELSNGSKLMDRSISLSPNNLANRMTRLRHMLGATIRSPRSFHKQVKSDIEYMEGCINSLSNEEKSNFLCAKGEYLYHLGEKKEGLNLIKEASKASPDSFIGQYSRVMYEKLVKDRD